MFLPVGFGPETLLVRQRVVDHCVSGSKAALGFNFADLATVSSTSTASSEDAPTTFASITSPSSLIEMFTISCALILSCELSPVLLSIDAAQMLFLAACRMASPYVCRLPWRRATMNVARSTHVQAKCRRDVLPMR